MSFSIFLILNVIIAAAGFFLGKYRALKIISVCSPRVKLHSRPIYYGLFTAI